MESIYRIRLLGTIQVEKDDVLVQEFDSRKALAMLGYLARQDQPVSRSHLAGLFWGEKTEARGRRNLSRELSQLSSRLPDCFQADYHTIQFQPAGGYWVDTVVFEDLVRGGAAEKLLEISEPGGDEASEVGLNAWLPQPPIDINAARLAEAAATFRGDFMAGYYLDDCPEFETWLLREQEEWRRRVTEVFEKLIGYYAGQDQDDQAEFYARRWLTVEPWRERGHRYLMALLARNGNRSAALAQFETCRRALAEELAVEPAAVTIALYERIKAGVPSKKVHRAGQQPARQAEPVSEGKELPASQPATVRVPTPSTPFVNRVDELAQLIEYLSDPACRLITVIGPGGIGKTRLAIEATLQTAATFSNSEIVDAAGQVGFDHGVYFVPLAPLSSADLMVSAIADVLSYSFYSGLDPATQLLNYLREKQLLLVLDNFDHLMAGVDLLADILMSAPKVKVLAASRERLNLQEEYLLPLNGMGIPNGENGKIADASSTLESYSAAQLFLHRARAVDPNFSPTEEDKASLIRICQLVEGIPLAIELAAAWVRMLSCAEIAREIERNLDFLASSLRNIPERHRSLRAVFDYSWQLLSPEEQHAFRRLAVFHGGFQKDAAEAVVGAPLPLLLALVDKSLLRRSETTGRFDRHVVLWQYAAEKLGEEPEEEATYQERHCDYYASFLQQKEALLIGEGQIEALAEIRNEIGNVRQCWNWAIAQSKIEAIEQVLESLFHFYDILSWFQEGVEAFERAAASLRESGEQKTQAELNEGVEKRRQTEIILSRVQARQGWLTFQIGQHESAKTLLQDSLLILRRLEAEGAHSELVFVLNYLGAVHRHLGDYEEAKEYLEESLTICPEVDDQFGLSIALNILSQVAYLQGDYPQARQLGNESLAIKRAIGDRRGIPFSLINLGRVAQALAQYAEAKELFEESLVICQEIDDRRGIGLCHSHLGDVARTQSDYRQAKQLYEESLTIFKEIGNQWGLIFSLTDLGNVACALEEYQPAQEYFNQALKMAMEIGSEPLALDVLPGLAALWLKIGETNDRVLEILTLILNHPASGRDKKNEAAALLAELEPQFSTETISETQTRPLETVVQEILQA